jgi:hypothetical protein
VTGRYPADRLLYRRQFVIGPRFLEEFSWWKRLTIGPFCLIAHPDLPTCQVSDGERSVTLLGYILDPDEWQLGDEPILRGLLSELSHDRLVRSLSRLGGRWVVVANTPRETLVFNDAFGMRQVHYTEGAMNDGAPRNRQCWPGRSASRSTTVPLVLSVTAPTRSSGCQARERSTRPSPA